MEASLEESMDSDHASSPISKPDARASPPGVGLNGNGNGSGSGSQETPNNGVAIAKEKPSEGQWCVIRKTSFDCETALLP